MSEGRMSYSERSFWAGLVIVVASFVLYGAALFGDHPFSMLDLLYHAMPMVLGMLLMAPKGAPMVIATVRDIWGKSRIVP